MCRISYTKLAILLLLTANTLVVCLGFKFWFEEDDPQECAVDQYMHDDKDFKSTDVVSRHKNPYTKDFYKALQRNDRILCWVMTYPDNHKRKAVHVKATWAKRFNPVLYMSSVEDKELPTIALPVPEGRGYLWKKTKEAFKYVYSHYNGTYDWVLKADDDTYVIEENLRYLLSHYDPNEPLYLGCKFKKYAKHGYMQGGAGYVLSKEAVRRLVVDGFEGGKCCNERSGVEDLGIGLCMEKLGVNSVDTRDFEGQGTFHGLAPEELIPPRPFRDEFSWYKDIIAYPMEKGMKCCSDQTISFHYVCPDEMYLMEFLLYKLRRYGANHDDDKLKLTSGKNL